MVKFQSLIFSLDMIEFCYDSIAVVYVFMFGTKQLFILTICTLYQLER
jgi:hypothetical protein